MKKALLIPANPAHDQASVEPVEWESMEDLQRFVGGYVERVRIGNPYTLKGFTDIVMVIDEEGTLKSRQFNPLASFLYGSTIHGGAIYGDALILGEGMTEEGPDFISLSQDGVRDMILEIYNGKSE